MNFKNDPSEIFVIEKDTSGSKIDIFENQNFPPSLLDNYKNLSTEQQSDVTYYFLLLTDQIDQYQGFNCNQAERKQTLIKEIAELASNITTILPVGYKALLEHIVEQMPAIQQNDFKEKLLTTWLGLYVNENAQQKQEVEQKTDTTDSVINKVCKAAQVVLKPSSLFNE